jgi:hypothetical protein
MTRAARGGGVSSDLWFPRIACSRARKQLRLGCPYASGDELISLGFRIGNPSAIGWHQWNFPASLLPVGATPTTSRRMATRSLRRKMARSPSRSGGRRTRLQLQTIPRGGVFFCALRLTRQRQRAVISAVTRRPPPKPVVAHLTRCSSGPIRI